MHASEIWNSPYLSTTVGFESITRARQGITEIDCAGVLTMSSQSDKQVIRNMYMMGISFVAMTVLLIGVATSVA